MPISFLTRNAIKYNYLVCEYLNLMSSKRSKTFTQYLHNVRYNWTSNCVSIQPQSISGKQISTPAQSTPSSKPRNCSQREASNKRRSFADCAQSYKGYVHGTEFNELTNKYDGAHLFRVLHSAAKLYSCLQMDDLIGCG